MVFIRNIDNVDWQCPEFYLPGVKADVVSKTGTWFSYGDVRLGQGKENARQWYYFLTPQGIREKARLTVDFQ